MAKVIILNKGKMNIPNEERKQSVLLEKCDLISDGKEFEKVVLNCWNKYEQTDHTDSDFIRDEVDPLIENNKQEAEIATYVSIIPVIKKANAELDHDDAPPPIIVWEYFFIHALDRFQILVKTDQGKMLYILEEYLSIMAGKVRNLQSNPNKYRSFEYGFRIPQENVNEYIQNYIASIKKYFELLDCEVKTQQQNKDLVDDLANVVHQLEGLIPIEQYLRTLLFQAIVYRKLGLVKSLYLLKDLSESTKVKTNKELLSDVLKEKTFAETRFLGSIPQNKNHILDYLVNYTNQNEESIGKYKESLKARMKEYLNSNPSCGINRKEYTRDDFLFLLCLYSPKEMIPYVYRLMEWTFNNAIPTLNPSNWQVKKKDGKDFRIYDHIEYNVKTLLNNDPVVWQELDDFRLIRNAEEHNGQNKNAQISVQNWMAKTYFQQQAYLEKIIIDIYEILSIEAKKSKKDIPAVVVNQIELVE